jgi:hypothetical protein
VIEDQQRRKSAPYVRGAEHDEERRRGGKCRQRNRVPLQPGAIDRHAVVDRATLRDGLLNEPFDKLLRLAFLRGRRGFDGAQNRRFERRIVLFGR